MLLRIICVLCAVVSFNEAAFAAKQKNVTPYDDIQTRLAMHPGQTYLAFMQNEVKPGLDAFEETIQNDEAFQTQRWGQLQKNLLAQGAGVAIRIDANNYIFNIGYLNGSDPANDVKSGRSYGVGPTDKQSDPSDIAYLRELEAYLSNEPQAAGEFVEALMLVITNCDTSGWSKLSDAGQVVATDFLAIYTAELDRHLMVRLAPRVHPWEIDLAAATFVSIFDVASGMLMQNGALVQGSIEGWWAQGATGSGIGNTRRDRLALTKLIAKAEANSEEAREISSIIGREASSDIIQGVLVYFNSENGPTEMSEADASRLTGLMKNYLVHVQMHIDQIISLQ